jgi:hypothetical protein
MCRLRAQVEVVPATNLGSGAERGYWTFVSARPEVVPGRRSPPQYPDQRVKPTFGIVFGEGEPLQGREAFRRAGLIS